MKKIWIGVQLTIPDNIFCLACGELLTENNWHKFNKNKCFYRCKCCFNAGAKLNPILKNLNKLKPEFRNCRVCNCILNNKNWILCDKNVGIYLCKPCKSNYYKEYNSDIVIKEKSRNEKEKLRNKAIVNLGGICTCCGENNDAFLTIDHINNDGAKERKLTGNKNIYELLNELNYPKDRYQLLCSNCNFSKGHQGICSHNILKEGILCTFCNIILTDKNIFKFHTESNHKICKDCSVKFSIKRENRIDNHTKTIRKKTYALNCRLNIINAYGGKCVCCDENDFYFLTLDHINGGGRKQNKQLKKQGIDFYIWLKQNNYPKDNYQLLCYNCNCAKSIYGTCPHNNNEKVIKRYLI